MTQKTWFITGTSRGFGREWAIAALERGDKVAATARNTASLDDLVAKYGDALLPIELAVTDRDADFAAVKQAHDHFGRLDIVVNNAGYGQFGFVEELSEQDVRDQFETNVFGALWVTQAALPYLREQRSGHIIQVSSIGGITAFPNVGIYSASKWALEGFSQALAQEVAPFGIHVTLIEPQGYDTDWSGSSSRRAVWPPRPPARAPRLRPRRVRVVVSAGRAAAGLRRRARRDRCGAQESVEAGRSRSVVCGGAQGRRCGRAAAAGVLRRSGVGLGQGRLRAAATHVGAVAVGRRAGSGLAHCP